MSDILGVSAFGGSGVSLRSPPQNLGQTMPKVAATADDTSATFNKGSTLPSQNGDSFDTTQSIREDAGAYAPTDPRDALVQKQPLDADILTGPTPAFQASLLEVESDLRNVIARVEAKRAQISDAAAIAPAPQKDSANSVSGSQNSLEISPTARRDLREVTPKTETQPAPEVKIESPQAEVQTEALDREAAYAGRAAIPETPYSKASAMDLS
ncbi:MULTISPECIES: hypothetical protein [Pacificibacter]|uniref:hypothetical protein n=1 Tax=Pacificibacter TaxID=1042323 RepID=UPI001C095578|nr:MULTISPECIES: hypothetical protein [Pacificibacter]MBU2935465.1 hypothetical protein [Pacificibacter marinus]MDO6613962.1 hypothetical protein [Pacificibacter sp. 1_MG-2023]